METTNDSLEIVPNAAFIGFAGTPLIATGSQRGRVDDWRSTVRGVSAPLLRKAIANAQDNFLWRNHLMKNWKRTVS